MSKITDIVEDLRNIENLSGSAQEVLVSGTNSLGMTEEQLDDLFIKGSKL